MKDEIMDVEFTNYVKDFLFQLGYTHILSLGVDDTESASFTKDKNICWLTPLLPGDSRIDDHDPDYIIAEIQSDEVIEMATGKDNTLFMIRVPVEDMNTFLKDR